MPTPAFAAAATGWTIGAGAGAFSRRGSAGSGAGCDGVMLFTTGCWRSTLASAVSAPGAFGSSGCSTIS